MIALGINLFAERQKMPGTYIRTQATALADLLMNSQPGHLQSLLKKNKKIIMTCLKSVNENTPEKHGNTLQKSPQIISEEKACTAVISCVRMRACPIFFRDIIGKSEKRDITDSFMNCEIYGGFPQFWMRA
jgi:hypothetical protein